MATNVAKGSKSQLIWKVESTLGEAPTTGDWNELPNNSESFGENIETVQSDDIRSDRENPSLRGGNIAVAGSVVHDFSPVRTLTFFRHMLAASSIATTTLTPTAIAASTAYNRGDVVLAAALGAAWICVRGGTTPADVTGLLTGTSDVTLSGGSKWQYVAANGTDVYQHVITPGTDFPAVGLSFQKAIKGGSSDVYFQFPGCRIGSLNLNVPQTGAVKATWNFSAIGEPVKSASTIVDGGAAVNLLSEDFYTGYDAYIHLNDTQGAGGKVFREFSVDFNNSLDESVYCVGERVKTDLPEGRKIATGRIGMYFLDSTEYDYFKNETELSLMLTLIHGGKMFKMEFPEIKLTGDGTPKTQGQGAIMQDFQWTAYYQDGASRPGKVTAINLTAGGDIPV